MDSNSNSSDMIWPKLEIDSGNDSPRDHRLNWSSENTVRLIKLLEQDCKELWDVKNPLNKDRRARQAKLDYLADQFGTVSEEISRKIHNLRSQLNNELRKIKRRQSAGGSGEASAAGGSGSGWEYFEALSFLVRMPANGGDPLAFCDALDAVDGVNLELAEFQANEEEEFGAAVARAQQPAALVTIATTSTTAAASTSQQAVRRRPVRVAASAPPPLPPNPLMWPPEEAVPRLRPGANSADECQIFGDFVASELRTLRSDDARKKLKRMIQKAILQIGEEEDVNIINSKYY